MTFSLKAISQFSLLVAGLNVGVAIALPERADAQDASDLVVFDWAGYEDQNLYPDYIEKHGGAPTFSFFGDDTEALQKIRSGFQVDLVHPCAIQMLDWKNQDILKPIDISRLTHWDDLSPALKNSEAVQSGGDVWMVPYDFGSSAIIYRTDLVENPVRDLEILADPAYAGRVALPANPMDLMILGGLYVGLSSLDDIDEESYGQIMDFLRRVHQNVLFYWADSTQLTQAMASGEVVLGFGWNNTAALLKADNVPVEYMTDAKQGLGTWVCGYGISATADPANEDLAYDFLNAATAPEVSVYLANAWGYGHSNEVGRDMIDPEVADTNYLSDSRESFNEHGYYYDFPSEWRNRAVEELTRIRAGF